MLQIIKQNGSSDINVVSPIPAGDNNIGNVDIASALPAGAAIIGKVGIDQTAGQNVVVVDGTDGTGITQPTGGLGSKGWLSGIYDRLSKVVLATGAAVIGKVGIDQTTPGTTNGVQVNAALPAGTNLLGKVGIDQTTPGVTNAVSIVGSLATEGSTLNGFFPGGATEYNTQVVHRTPAVYPGSDNLPGNPSWTPVMLPMNLFFNGTNWDRQRGNTQDTILASAAQTASLNSADITIYNGAKLAVYLDVTAASGTSPTLDVTVKAKDPASGKYFLIGTFTQKTGITSDALFIGSGADTKFATRIIRVEAVIGGTTPSFTFSVGYSATVS